MSETDQAVEAVQQVQADMSRIESGAQQTDGLLRQISAALEEQASAVEEITATVVELSRLADGTRGEVERFRLAQA